MSVSSTRGRRRLRNGPPNKKTRVSDAQDPMQGLGECLCGGGELLNNCLSLGLSNHGFQRIPATLPDAICNGCYRRRDRVEWLWAPKGQVPQRELGKRMRWCARRTGFVLDPPHALHECHDPKPCLSRGQRISPTPPDPPAPKLLPARRLGSPLVRPACAYVFIWRRITPRPKSITSGSHLPHAYAYHMLR